MNGKDDEEFKGPKGKKNWSKDQKGGKRNQNFKPGQFKKFKTGGGGGGGKFKGKR